MTVIIELQEQGKEFVDSSGVEWVRDDIPIPPRYWALFCDKFRHYNLIDRSSLGLWLRLCMS